MGICISQPPMVKSKIEKHVNECETYVNSKNNYYATSGLGKTYKITEELAFKRSIQREYRRNKKV
jgi:hypothetical protein